MQQQQRLTRSTTDVILTGVCGGLGEYFNIDPIIARLIFVVVTLASGFGIPAYILLWLLMPKGKQVPINTVPNPHGTSQAAPNPGVQSEQTGQPGALGQPAQPAQPTQQPVSNQQSSSYQAPPTPDAYRFDPQTGQPISPATPATGETIKLDLDNTSHASMQYPPNDVTFHTTQTEQLQERNDKWRKLGLVLMGVGGLVLLNHFNIGMSVIIPPLMIIAGVVLLKRSQ